MQSSEYRVRSSTELGERTSGIASRPLHPLPGPLFCRADRVFLKYSPPHIAFCGCWGKSLCVVASFRGSVVCERVSARTLACWLTKTCRAPPRYVCSTKTLISRRPTGLPAFLWCAPRALGPIDSPRVSHRGYGHAVCVTYVPWYSMIDVYKQSATNPAVSP